MNDLIKRDDALDILCECCGITEDVEKCRKTSADGWCKEYCKLKNMPTVEAEPIRHGHWIVEFENDNGRDLRCSECRTKFYVGKGRDGNYCPNCGAKMDEEEE